MKGNVGIRPSTYHLRKQRAPKTATRPGSLPAGPADDDLDIVVVVALEAVEEVAEEIPELAEGEEQTVAEQRGQRRRVRQPHHLAPLIPTGSPPGSGSETPPELPAEIIGLSWPESSFGRIRILG